MGDNTLWNVGPVDIMDKLTSRATSAIPLTHIVTPRSDPNQVRNSIQDILGSTEPCDFRGRFIGMSLFNDTEFRKPGNEQTCIENSKEVPNTPSKFS